MVEPWTEPVGGSAQVRPSGPPGRGITGSRPLPVVRLGGGGCFGPGSEPEPEPEADSGRFGIRVSGGALVPTTRKQAVCLAGIASLACSGRARRVIRSGIERNLHGGTDVPSHSLCQVMESIPSIDTFSSAGVRPTACWFVLRTGRCVSLVVRGAHTWFQIRSVGKRDGRCRRQFRRRVAGRNP